MNSFFSKTGPIKKSTNNKCWRGCAEKGTLLLKKEFGVVGSDMYSWGIKDFHKCWSGSLAKSRLCFGPTGIINCTPLSALSF